jgi:hypothetical protein
MKKISMRLNKRSNQKREARRSRKSRLQSRQTKRRKSLLEEMFLEAL